MRRGNQWALGLVMLSSVFVTACGEDPPDPGCERVQQCCQALEADSFWNAQDGMRYCPVTDLTNASSCRSTRGDVLRTMGEVSAREQRSLPPACSQL